MEQTRKKEGGMTAGDRKHLAMVANIGCIVCRNNGNAGTPAEIHHLRDGVGIGQRSQHKNSIPLCHAHHRTGGYGVAFHAGKKAFEGKYGTERELLAQVNDLLAAA
jgi:hypothetical protein